MALLPADQQAKTFLTQPTEKSYKTCPIRTICNNVQSRISTWQHNLWDRKRLFFNPEYAVHFGHMNAGGLLILPQRRAATRSRRRRLSLSGKNYGFRYAIENRLPLKRWLMQPVSPSTLSVMASAYAHLTGPPVNKNHEILQVMWERATGTHLLNVYSNNRRVSLHIKISKWPTLNSEISESARQIGNSYFRHALVKGAKAVTLLNDLRSVQVNQYWPHCATSRNCRAGPPFT